MPSQEDWSLILGLSRQDCARKGEYLRKDTNNSSQSGKKNRRRMGQAMAGKCGLSATETNVQTLRATTGEAVEKQGNKSGKMAEVRECQLLPQTGRCTQGSKDEQDEMQKGTRKYRLRNFSQTQGKEEETTTSQETAATRGVPGGDGGDHPPTRTNASQSGGRGKRSTIEESSWTSSKGNKR